MFVCVCVRVHEPVRACMWRVGCLCTYVLACMRVTCGVFMHVCVGVHTCGVWRVGCLCTCVWACIPVFACKCASICVNACDAVR